MWSSVGGKLVGGSVVLPLEELRIKVCCTITGTASTNTNTYMRALIFTAAVIRDSTKTLRVPNALPISTDVVKKMAKWFLELFHECCKGSCCYWCVIAESQSERQVIQTKYSTPLRLPQIWITKQNIHLSGTACLPVDASKTTDKRPLTF